MRREYPEGPIVGVGAIIVEKGWIVLVQRGNPPSKGLWTFPGGVVELGESLEEAVRREAMEETGLEVQVGEVATVLDRVVRDETGRVQYHYVIIDYVVRPVGGELRAGEDAADARWFGEKEMESVEMTEPAGEIARRMLREA